MVLAAARIEPVLAPPARQTTVRAAGPARWPGPLAFASTVYATASARRGPGAVRALSFTVDPGETVALTGPTGSGQEHAPADRRRAARAEPGQRQRARRPRLPIWPEAACATLVTWCRSARLWWPGSLRDNLRIAAPDADDCSRSAQPLEACALTADLRSPAAGSTPQLGPGGSGLSGGEARRLVLARALLRQPRRAPAGRTHRGARHRPRRGSSRPGLRRRCPTPRSCIAAHRASKSKRPPTASSRYGTKTHRAIQLLISDASQIRMIRSKVVFSSTLLTRRPQRGP